MEHVIGNWCPFVFVFKLQSYWKVLIKLGIVDLLKTLSAEFHLSQIGWNWWEFLAAREANLCVMSRPELTAEASDFSAWVLTHKKKTSLYKRHSQELQTEPD
jgi:hypothetical protein